MARHHLLFAALVMAGATSADAGIIVLGNSAARSCYELARDDSAAASAVQTCTRALSDELLPPGDRVATLVNRGIIFKNRGEMANAHADFDAAIRRDPDEGDAYLNKALTLARQEGWSEALPLFDTALDKDTRLPALAYYGRGVAHEMTGRVKDAYRDYQQAATLAPEWQEPKVELARFVRRGR